jgi:hypothetical protein
MCLVRVSALDATVAENGRPAIQVKHSSTLALEVKMAKYVN